jgi:hypothetical protein
VSLFRKHTVPSLSEAFGGRIVERTQGRDTFTIPADGDGRVHQPCWFCGEALDFDLASAPDDVAIVMIEPFSHHGPMHGVCHRSCAEQARHVSAQ